MNFNKLIGQSELRSLLHSTLLDGKLSHATLLTGPSGSGKKSWARILAQSILCADESTVEPCETCNSCRNYKSGNHPGLFFIEPDGRRIKIEQLRTIREKFYLSGGKKVCLMDDAEKMTAETASSLLKILEEPPADLYFILIAEEPRFLLDTIVSRCQRYTLYPLRCEEVKELLIKEKEISEEKADLLARISGGLPGRAFQLADDEAFEERFREAKTLAFNIASGCDSVRQLLSWALFLSEKDDIIPFLELVCMIYRDGLVQNLCRSGESIITPEEQSSWIESVKPAAFEEAIFLINDAVCKINDTNANRRLLLERMLILLQRRLTKCPGS